MRMGLHIQGAYDKAEAYIRAVRPPVVKFLDDAPVTLVNLVNGYGGLTILRVYREGQGLGRFDEYLRDIERAARGSAVRAIEVSHNEAHQAGAELARKAQLDIEGMKLAERLGKIGVVGCFSVGMPDLDDWHLYRPALEYAAKRGHLLAKHEYGGGRLGMDMGVVGDGKAARGYFCLRYRRDLDWAHRAMVPMPKIVITEAGIDDLTPHVPDKTRGYKAATHLHPPEVGDYATQAARYARRLAEDGDRVVGWVDFGFGAQDPQWGGFNLATDDRMLERMTNEMRRLPDVAAPQPPKEVPPVDVKPIDFYGVLVRHLGARLVDQRATLPDVTSPRYGKFGGRLLGAIDTIAVHHTAGPKSQTPRQVYDFHTGPQRQWSGIGYHLLIQGGRVHYVGDMTTARACVADLNPRVICVCVAGDYTTERLDDSDAEALRLTVGAIQAWAQAALGRRLGVKGHGELPGQATACPGGNLLPLVRELAGAPPTKPAPVTGKPDMGKVAWALEEATRILEREGLAAEAAFVGRQYTTDAIRRRDGR